MKQILNTLIVACLLSAAHAADPSSAKVTLEDFKLVGTLTAERATFTLTATANVEDRKGGSLELLSGAVALTDLAPHPKWQLRAEQNRFVVSFDRSGKYPVQLKFDAAVRQADGWNAVEFRVAPSTLRPILLQGLAADTQFEFPGAARPDRSGTDFKSYLPSDGTVKFAWKLARPEAEGKLFYAAEMLSQISVSPGLMRQAALLDFKVMQGELSRVALVLHGAGEVTRVGGEQVLSWNVEPLAGSADRRLVVQFNQPQKEAFTLLVQTQTPLGAFPQTAEPMQVRPESATRFAGHFRIVNDGAVRLEVLQATGLSQISPDQFPESDVTRSVLRPTGSQRFAYRFSGPEFALRIQADQILPELSVSQVLAYRLGENELAIEDEIELDVREAPLRELQLRVPKGYAIARLTASGLSDWNTREPENQADAELRLVYGQPVSGRQIIQLRLERNKPLGETTWALPRVEIPKAKSVRGSLGVAADAGFRLTPERSQGLTEIATAFFPRKLPGLQTAFRISDPAWQVSVRVERLPQTVQADALHLFSIGEGIAYGSSLLNYVVSGAPVSAFKVELADDLLNVEFTGKDIRTWQKTEGGYVVQLHTPVSGNYTLLATYERPFKAQGDTLAFTGARPLDAQSEQGNVIIVSAYQFEVKAADVSAGLLALETAEVPPEYRLFFDAPILKAYRYSTRPFNLKLALSPLAQGDSLNQVVDRASLTTRISKEGQAVTDIRYYVKNRGNPHLRLTLPEGTRLWSATVNGASVVPVLDAKANLIPLPQYADPNAVLQLDLKVAAPAKEASRVRIDAPMVEAPVMLAEWILKPDTGQRLAYRSGSLTPVGGFPDVSGFAQLTRTFSVGDASREITLLVAGLALAILALVVWRSTCNEGVFKFSARHVAGTVVGLLAFVIALVLLAGLGGSVWEHRTYLSSEITLLAPVEQAGSALHIEVSNLEDKASGAGLMSCGWPVLLALVAWCFAGLSERRAAKTAGLVLGWLVLGWAALRCPNGGMPFVILLGAFLVLHGALPSLRRLWQLPRRPQAPPLAEPPSAIAPAATALLVGGLILGSVGICQGGALAAAPELSNSLEANPEGWQMVAGGRSGQQGERPPEDHSREQSHPGRGARHFQLAPSTVGVRSGDLGIPQVPSPSPRPSPLGRGSDVVRSSQIPNLMDSPTSGREFPLSPRERAGVRGNRTLQNPTHAILPGASAAHHRTLRLASKTLPDGASSKLAVSAPAPLPESVTHDIRIEDQFVLAMAKFRWDAKKDQVLPLLFEPAVLTQITYPKNDLTLVERTALGEGGATNAALRAVQQLLARKTGLFDIEVQYQLPVKKQGPESGFTLPVPYGLVNGLKLTVVNLDVDVLSPQAVSVQRDVVGSNTVASLVLSPSANAWVGWKPRSRDVKREKPVFYAEVSQLYVPAAGAIEGAHYAVIRPAQGELSELTFTVPSGAAITDVTDGLRAVAAVNTRGQTQGSIVSLWRFDPDTRKLRVNLNPPQSRPFALLVRSQVATGPLPIEQPVGLLGVDGAATQTGLLGIATGNEVQLDSVSADALLPINLEDFPAEIASTLQAQIPGLTVRRAFRYSEKAGQGTPPASADSSGSQTGASATLALRFTLKASAVEPDVRVETQDTISLGEDRTVLAANVVARVTRAGIFRLSFVMPSGFDVESISGPALSHWTELKTDAGRLITLHLTGKTEGQQQFAISLAGPGVKATNGWATPQLVLREASKQDGTLLLVPEQGLRLQVASLDGLSELDPQKSGIKQKGVLAFRVLQTPRKLSLNVEQVDPWIQVTSLQHATVNEALVKVAANLQYQIDNTGLKAFRVFLPTNAESVRFQGDQVAGFSAVAGAMTNGLQAWEIKLHRRVIGAYLLQAAYQTPMPDRSPETVLRGLQAAGVNSQRGFVTVQSGGRLQVHIDAQPEALQATEWQGIPRALRQDLPAAAANFAYRLVEPDFQLTLKLERHDAAKLLEARVNRIEFASVISDDGVMLTQARLEMLPGDKRLLDLVLPKGAHFWFAFINQNGVWPWRQQDHLLVPLEQQSRRDKPILVEIFYSSQIGLAAARTLDLDLVAPKFDLPLENISWRVSLNDKWQLKHWTGSLQLQEEQVTPQPAMVDLQSYLQNEAALQRERTKQAKDLYATGNTALEQGDPQQARRAFQAAYGLSTHDAAFNEDARVQLHNIKLQQALIGLNVRQAGAVGDPAALGGKFRDLRNRKEVNYSQQDAKDIIDRNTADDNAAFMRLAERLIQQQDAAVSTPTALRASIPEQGRVLTFQRTVAVDPGADLQIRLEATAVKAASSGTRIVILGGILAVLALFAMLAGRKLPASSFGLTGR